MECERNPRENKHIMSGGDLLFSFDHEFFIFQTLFILILLIINVQVFHHVMTYVLHVFTDNVASLAMGKSARRSIKSDDPSSPQPTSSPYIYYQNSTSRPESYQLWLPNQFISPAYSEALR